MDKRLVFIIKPAIHDLESIHKSFWIISKISFSVSEFVVVDSCQQRFLVDAILHLISKNVFNHLHKLIFLTFLSIFRNDRENRLIHTVVIRTHNVFSDSGIGKGLLKRCSRCR